MKNIVAISIRSIARHERDHCGRPELAGVIEGAADEIDRLEAENGRLRAALQWIVDNTGCDTLNLYAYDMAREVLAHEQAAPKKDDPPDGWMPDGSWSPGG